MTETDALITQAVSAVADELGHKLKIARTYERARRFCGGMWGFAMRLYSRDDWERNYAVQRQIERANGHEFDGTPQSHVKIFQAAPEDDRKILTDMTTRLAKAYTAEYFRHERIENANSHDYTTGLAEKLSRTLRTAGKHTPQPL